ncbi:NUDIX domain-containing protein [Nitratifractor sp.]
MKPNIENFRLEPLREGRFVRPFLARFSMDGEERTWELVRSGDSVAVLIWHRERERFVLVRQFRPAVYVHNYEGMTVELCAGLVDKDLPIERIAAEEVEEECGYRVDPKALRKVTSYYASVGFSGSRQTLFYVEVDESMHIGPGGGIPGEEAIEVVELSPEEGRSLLFDEETARTPGLLFALTWWFSCRPTCPPLR